MPISTLIKTSHTTCKCLTITEKKLLIKTYFVKFKHKKTNIELTLKIFIVIRDRSYGLTFVDI